MSNIGVRVMPKFKQNETEFELSIYWGGTQYRATIPKVLINRIIKQKKKVYGTFIMDANALHLKVVKNE